MRASARLEPPSLIDAGRAAGRELRDVRIAVSAITRARTASGERTVRIAGLSAKTALLVSSDALGSSGQTLDLDVPVAGGRDLVVMAGIARAERLRDGWVTHVEFVIVEIEVRRQLNELLALLLAGEPDVVRPAVVYDTIVSYGPKRGQKAYLQEVSLTGLQMRVGERLAHDAIVEVTLPPFRAGAPIEVRGRVTGQRLSAERGYITTLDFEPLDDSRRHALGTLIADLMCR